MKLRERQGRLDDFTACYFLFVNNYKFSFLIWKLLTVICHNVNIKKLQKKEVFMKICWIGI